MTPLKLLPAFLLTLLAAYSDPSSAAAAEDDHG